MKAKVNIPVTVKTRIGVDHNDSYEFLKEFITTVANAGCEVFIIHARKAWLKGLSPKENRELPPIHYEVVYQLKKDFPKLTIVINGEIKTLTDAQQHLKKVDGVMIGREAYHNPYLLTQIDSLFFNSKEYVPSRQEILERYIPYVQQRLTLGVPLHLMIHPILGLFHGVPGARAWRRYLSENSHQKGRGVEVIREAFSLTTT
jgi:tRNA-dihydrouridine synthase A